MRFSARVVVTGFLLVVGMALVSQADPPVNTTCNEQCEILVPELFSTQGECMSACNTCLNKGYPSSALVGVCLCHQLEDLYGWEESGYKNMGECIADVK